MKASVRAKTTITYHGRTGRPKLHWSGTGNPYIMVRRKKGGTKRLYLRTKGAYSQVTNIRSLISEASQRFGRKVFK